MRQAALSLALRRVSVGTLTLSSGATVSTTMALLAWASLPYTLWKLACKLLAPWLQPLIWALLTLTLQLPSAATSACHCWAPRLSVTRAPAAMFKGVPGRWSKAVPESTKLPWASAPLSTLSPASAALHCSSGALVLKRNSPAGVLLLGVA